MDAAGVGDEQRHEPGSDDTWTEAWSFDFWADDGIGGSARLALVPALGVAWYWACVVVPERGPVVVRDDEVPLPPGEQLLVKSDSLWAELVCEEPFEFWTLGLEAYGVRLDDPSDAYRGEIGERLAVGFDLEWEADMSVHDFGSRAGFATRGYGQAGTVRGELLLGDEEIDFDGFGAREHAWGPLEWWSVPWHRSAFRVGELLALGLWQGAREGDTAGYVWRLGEGSAPVESLRVETHPGPEGIPAAARYVVDQALEVDVEVLAAAPVPLAAPGGRRARLPRALCRFTVEGQVGFGWAEWLQPGAA